MDELNHRTVFCGSRPEPVLDPSSGKRTLIQQQTPNTNNLSYFSMTSHSIHSSINVVIIRIFVTHQPSS